MHAIRWVLNFFRYLKCPVKYNFEGKPLCSTFKIGVCVRVIFQVGLGLHTAYVKSKEDILWPLHTVFLARTNGEVYEKGEGTLCDSYSRRHASNYVISGQNQLKGWIVQSSGLITIDSWLDKKPAPNLTYLSISWTVIYSLHTAITIKIVYELVSTFFI